MQKIILSILILLLSTIGHAGGFAENLVAGARAQVGVTTDYDGSYQAIGYPGGDVPLTTGVCSDVIVRAFRAVGFDLQVLIHEDISAHFSLYPQINGQSVPDKNIDHRRVKNLAVFFSRYGETLPITDHPTDFLPGDVVVWAVPLPHIGIVSDKYDGETPQVIHNIGAGAQEEDALFDYKITGHFRYLPGE